MKVKVCFALFVLVSLACATPAPIPAFLSNTMENITVTTSTNTTLLCNIVPGGCGGQFYGTVGTDNNVAFWCVDDQLNFGSGASGPANIVLLDAINGTNTQYGGLDNTHFTNGLGGTYSAPARYEMEAYLISQYDGFSTGLISGETLTQDAIQEAIWAIMNNDTHPGVGYHDINGAISSVTPNTEDGYWIYQATQNYAGVNLEGWAAVTWVVDASTGTIGVPGAYGDIKGAASQTFLVRVTPEPGFYGALALGMSGLVFFVRRRKRA
jgi:hypothetical protein